MTITHVNIVQAFVNPALGIGGNPAGVVLDADTLSNQEKQFVASQVGFSETAFVSKSQKADFKLEFFTPTRQIPHCGHATIAAFSFLVQQGRLKKSKSSKETIDGIRAIFIQDKYVFMEQTKPLYTPLDPIIVERVLKSLGLSRKDLMAGHQPLVVNTGNSFLIVPLNGGVLENIRAELREMEIISQLCGLIGYYVFAMGIVKDGYDATARMFAPLYGIPEESATGMAAGPLACYLHDYCRLQKQEMRIAQGYFMQPPSPSELVVRLDIEHNAIKDLMVGGIAQLSHRVEVSINTKKED